MVTTKQRFGELLWHDSELREISLFRSDSLDCLRIRVMMRLEKSARRLVDITFRDSTNFEADLDLAGKQLCSDAIWSASCLPSSSWRDKIMQNHPGNGFEGQLHFRIDLVDPGGLINILARDFSVEEVKG